MKFKPGKRDRANEIVESYFEPATMDAKTAVPTVYHLQTGEWDWLVVWPLSGGLADMQWKTSPEDAKWMPAFYKRAGGKEAGDKILAEWDSLVETERMEVSHTHSK